LTAVRVPELSKSSSAEVAAEVLPDADTLD
jgi:hypothetical protein